MDTNNEVLFGAEDDDWGDIDFSDLAEESTPTDEAAQAQEGNATESSEANPAEETPADGAQEPETPAPEVSTDQYFDLKVLGEDRRLTRDEMIAAAQKGLDYDRIRGKYSELQKEREANAPALELVRELAEAQGIPVPELITNVRAAALARKEGISLEAATEQVKLKAREDAVSKREAVFKEQDDAVKQEAAAREARSKQFVAFFQAHPDVKPEDIPQQCFTDMKNGIPLEYSFSRQIASRQRNESAKALSEKNARIKELEAQLAQYDKNTTQRLQNQLNAVRSVGSADTAGRASKGDAFDEAWYDGT